jgi:hypothetical protein
MAIGIVRTIPAGSHQQVTIPSGNYLWPTIRVLNPNDGVVYVKQNADVTNTGSGSWDYKVPSQSFGLLPGGGEGWQSVGMYYLDMSGANLPGEISIYLTQQVADEPTFQSIGRAAVTQSSSVDIASGAQPANPGAGFGRLWIDSGGHLNVLQPTGTNYNVVDSNNINTYLTLGGDLYGTVSAAHINVKYNDHIDLTYNNGTQQRVIQPINNDNYIFAGNSGIMYFWSDTPGVNLGNWNANTNRLTVGGSLAVSGDVYGRWFHANDGTNGLIVADVGTLYFRSANGDYQFDSGGAMGITGNLNVTGPVVFSNTLRVSASSYLNDAYVDRGNGTGVLYYAGNTGIYLYYDGSNFILAGGTNLNIGGKNLTSVAAINATGLVQGSGFMATATGYAFYCQGAQNAMYWDNSSLNQWSGQGSIFRLAHWGVASFDFTISGNGAINCDGTYMRPSLSLYFNTVGNQVLWPNGSYISGNAGYVQGSRTDLKENITEIPDSVCLLQVIDPRMPIREYQFVGDESARLNIGFLAEDVEVVLPNLVLYDDNKQLIGYATTELTNLLWGAVRQLNKRMDNAGIPVA